MFSSDQRAVGQLLVASQVILSLQLPFAIWPLIWITSSTDKMSVRFGEVDSVEDTHDSVALTVDSESGLVPDVTDSSESDALLPSSPPTKLKETLKGNYLFKNYVY